MLKIKSATVQAQTFGGMFDHNVKDSIAIMVMTDKSEDRGVIRPLFLKEDEALTMRKVIDQCILPYEDIYSMELHKTMMVESDNIQFKLVQISPLVILEPIDIKIDIKTAYDLTELTEEPRNGGTIENAPAKYDPNSNRVIVPEILDFINKNREDLIHFSASINPDFKLFQGVDVEVAGNTEDGFLLYIDLYGYETIQPSGSDFLNYAK